MDFINRVLNITNDKYKEENIKKIKSTLHNTADNTINSKEDTDTLNALYVSILCKITIKFKCFYLFGYRFDDFKN